MQVVKLVSHIFQKRISMTFGHVSDEKTFLFAFSHAV